MTSIALKDYGVWTPPSSVRCRAASVSYELATYLLT